MYESSSSLNKYKQEIGLIPLVTKEEEVELAAKIKRGDQGAKDNLVKANLRLVVKIAHAFEGGGVSLEDLISEGNIGLMRAAEKFDPSKGAKFSSYSAWWIKQAMRKVLLENCSEISIPVETAHKMKKVNAVRARLWGEYGRDPTNYEIARQLDYTPGEVEALKKHDPGKVLLLNDPLTSESEKGTFMDLIPGTSESRFKIVTGMKRDPASIREYVKRLDERERKIITLRYGLDGERPLTLRETSSEIRKSLERVRQIQRLAEKKLDRMIREDEEEERKVGREYAQRNGYEENGENTLAKKEKRRRSEKLKPVVRSGYDGELPNSSNSGDDNYNLR